MGAHHDAWFRGAFDDATGVAAMLAVARGLVELGVEPRHSIAFSSRTGEEYGMLDTPYDWCTGAWRQVTESHPEWRESVAFHLCAEANGHPELRTTVEAPPELYAWARAKARAADAEGWLPSGWRMNPPATGTEQWPFLVEGIPGVAAYTWDKSFARSDYHTANDTISIVDFEQSAGMARFYAYLLLSADAEAATMLDHRARARSVERATAGLPGDDRAVRGDGPPRPGDGARGVHGGRARGARCHRRRRDGTPPHAGRGRRRAARARARSARAR